MSQYKGYFHYGPYTEASSAQTQQAIPTLRQENQTKWPDKALAIK